MTAGALFSSYSATHSQSKRNKTEGAYAASKCVKNTS
ncbi:hypothetical protein ACZ87_02913, partial [Candidatus Erwinia dacicola]